MNVNDHKKYELSQLDNSQKKGYEDRGRPIFEKSVLMDRPFEWILLQHYEFNEGKGAL